MRLMQPFGTAVELHRHPRKAYGCRAEFPVRVQELLQNPLCVGRFSPVRGVDERDRTFETLRRGLVRELLVVHPGLNAGHVIG